MVRYTRFRTMFRTAGRAALLTLLLASTPLVEARSQDPAARPLPRVTLAQSVGPADGAVAVPLQLAGREDQPLGSVTLRIQLPEPLTFTSAEIGGLGISIGAEATTKTETKDGATVVEVTIAAPATDGVRPPLPDGPIAQLMFKLAKGLKPETVIPVKFEAAGLGPGPDAAAVPVSAVHGEIIVANPTVISCFFYMH